MSYLKSAVRVTHTPTGEVVIVSNQRAQHKNKLLALKILRGRLWALANGGERVKL